MRVRCLSTGRVRPKRDRRGVRRYLPGGWSSDTLPVHAFAVDHPRGICLFDTGQTARAAKRGHFPWWHPFFRLSRFELQPEDEAATQLRSRSVRWVVLSHLHTDHVGGIEAFSASDVIVSRVEWERAQGWRGRIRGYLPQYWPPSVEPLLIGFEGPPVGPFAGSFDVAGDGILLLVPTPGHTPGHLALLVREEDEQVLVAGDAAYTREELFAAAPDVAEWCSREDVRVLLSHEPAPGTG